MTKAIMSSSYACDLKVSAIVVEKSFSTFHILAALRREEPSRDRQVILVPSRTISTFILVFPHSGPYSRRVVTRT